jgi:sugar lactone lactonase YvrE
VFFVAIALSSACEKPKQETTTTAAQQTAATMTTQATPTTPHVEPTAMQPAQPGKPVVTFKDDIKTPESVLYDDATDNYLVSNINGKPTDMDNNGFIMKLSADGKVVEKKWIEGGAKAVTLNAPKGMAFMDDKLFVADIDTVRIFDRKTGAPAGEVKVPGATFLNDMTAAPDGTHVLVSDTGVKKGGSEPSGTDAVYSIDKNKKLTTIAKGKDLGQPNGLLATADKTWVVTMGTGELYSLDAHGKKADVQKLPKGMLDGIVGVGGDLLISSWEGQVVYRGKPGGEFKVAVEDVKSPADIGYDTKRMRLLVPLFEKDEVRAYEIR